MAFAARRGGLHLWRHCDRLHDDMPGPKPVLLTDPVFSLVERADADQEPICRTVA